MLIYIYDEKTKEYLKSEEAACDPLETERVGEFVPLLAANASFDAPLAVREGFVSVWNDTTWEYVEDPRKETYWLPEDRYGSQGREMKELGPLPEGATLIAPEKTFEEFKEEKLQEIKNAYLTAVSAPAWLDQECEMPNSEQVVIRRVGYDTDQQSQIDFNSSFERAKLKGNTLYNIYVNPDNLKEKEFTYHTPAMFERALLAAGEYQEGVYAKYYILKAQVEASSSKEELDVIVW